MTKTKVLERGQKRMLHIKIWQNESFSTMSPEARLLYIGLIILADDDGRLKGNSVLLKSLVFPFDAKMSLEDFKNILKEVLKSKLVEIYRVKGEYFISHPNWNRYQSIRADLYKPSLYPENQLRLRNESVTKTLTKGKERKGKERKREEAEAYLKNIPKNDLEEFYQKFNASRKDIILKAENLFDWCESNGKYKDNYKAFLRIALDKDFDRRTTPPAPAMRPETKPKSDLDAKDDRKPIPEDIKRSMKEILNRTKT